jgi:hypothetical protein
MSYPNIVRLNAVRKASQSAKDAPFSGRLFTLCQTNSHQNRVNASDADCGATLNHSEFRIFAAMIERLANFPRAEMELFAGHSTVGKPRAFRIDPERCDPVDKPPFHGRFFSLRMVTWSPRARSAAQVLHSSVQHREPSRSINPDAFNDRLSAVRGDRQRAYLADAPDDTKHDHPLAGSTPPPATSSGAAKGGFIAFQFPFKELAQLFGINVAGAQQTVKPLCGWARGHARTR